MAGKQRHARSGLTQKPAPRPGHEQRQRFGVLLSALETCRRSIDEATARRIIRVLDPTLFERVMGAALATEHRLETDQIDAAIKILEDL